MEVALDLVFARSNSDNNHKGKTESSLLCLAYKDFIQEAFYQNIVMILEDKKKGFVSYDRCT